MGGKGGAREPERRNRLVERSNQIRPGHVFVNWRKGLKQSAPMFIPFVGAVIFIKQFPDDPTIQSESGAGGPAAGMLAALGCLGEQLWQLYRLDRWLKGGPEVNPPRAGPIWAEVISQFARLRRQSRKLKRKISRLLEQFQQATAALPDAADLVEEDHDLSRAFFGQPP